MYFLVIFFMVIVTAFGDNSTYQNVRKGNNLFNTDLYKQIAVNVKSNVVFSSLSAETVLALLLSGCKGATAQQLSQVLHLPNDNHQVQNEVKSLMTDLQSSQTLIFNIANAAFLQKNFKILQSFLDVAKNDFKAYCENLDFSQGAQAADTINQWVSQETNGTIQNLIAPGALNAATRLVLVNALYFKGNWSKQFSAGDTFKEDFHRSSSDVVQVDTMHLTGVHFNYFECSTLKAQFLELPFQGNDVSMVLVVPTEIDGLAELEKKLCFFNAKIQLQSTYLNIAIPKFKFDFDIDFKPVLEKLGATKIFSASEVDLSGISGKPGDLVVDQVKQKAHIDVNEGGVVAAAATYVAIGLTASLPQRAKDFKADRSFIFYIKYKGIIAFAGKVKNPKY